jgi:hypothetical protein
VLKNKKSTCHKSYTVSQTWDDISKRKRTKEFEIITSGNLNSSYVTEDSCKRIGKVQIRSMSTGVQGIRWNMEGSKQDQMEGTWEALNRIRWNIGGSKWDQMEHERH